MSLETDSNFSWRKSAITSRIWRSYWTWQAVSRWVRPTTHCSIPSPTEPEAPHLHLPQRDSEGPLVRPEWPLSITAALRAVSEYKSRLVNFYNRTVLLSLWNPGDLSSLLLSTLLPWLLWHFISTVCLRNDMFPGRQLQWTDIVLACEFWVKQAGERELSFWIHSLAHSFIHHSLNGPLCVYFAHFPP